MPPSIAMAVGTLIPASGNSASGLGEAPLDCAVVPGAVPGAAAVDPGQIQVVWLVHDGLRQNPAEQIIPFSQFAFDPQVPLQAFGAPARAGVGEGDGLGLGVGLGEGEGVGVGEGVGLGVGDGVGLGETVGGAAGAAGPPAAGTLKLSSTGLPEVGGGAAGADGAATLKDKLH